MSTSVDHVCMAGNTMLCEHCGARQELTLPQPVGSVTKLIKAWVSAHRKCKARPGASAFRTPTSVADWMRSDDTGLSSITLYRHMTGMGMYAGQCHHPLDPDDFGRCHRLLNLAPEWRERIAEMTKYGPEWAALSGAWDELTAMYEAEKYREMYDWMVALRTTARRAAGGAP